MILCVTPNPAIDRTMHVNALRLGEVHRAEKVLMAAGGKGLNVARTIRALGGETVCMGLIGGHTGNLLADLAKQEGLSARWTQTQSETRTCVILVEDGRDATVVNEHGAEVDADAAQLFCNDVWKMSEQADLVCVSGSLPPGFSTDVFHAILTGLVERKKSVWVDTSGKALSAALKVHGINIKVNAGELGAALGFEISNAKQAKKASAQVREREVASVIVTLGKDGAILNSSSVWFAKPPMIEAVSSVGSGDAFLGGLALALESGHSPKIALRYGVAAGAANALHFGGGLVTPAEFTKIYEMIEVYSM